MGDCMSLPRLWLKVTLRSDSCCVFSAFFSFLHSLVHLLGRLSDDVLFALFGVVGGKVITSVQQVIHGMV